MCIYIYIYDYILFLVYLLFVSICMILYHNISYIKKIKQVAWRTSIDLDVVSRTGEEEPSDI